MQFHPHSTNWFEAKLPRQQTVYALEVLADSGYVQLEEKGSKRQPCADTLRLQQLLSDFDRLSNEHATDLPAAIARQHKVLRQPEDIAASALENLQHWAEQVQQTRQAIDANREQAVQLLLLHDCLDAMRDSSREITGLGQDSQFLYKHLFACPHGESCEALPCEEVYSVMYPGRLHDFWLVAGNISKKRLLDGAAALYNCIPVEIPDWLPPEIEDQARMLGNRQDHVDRHYQELQQQLQALRSDRELAAALSDIQLLHWLHKECFNEPSDPGHCRVVGWTLSFTPERLEGLLHSYGIDAQIVFAPPPQNLVPPVDLQTRRWNSPFRLFVDLLGTPGREEIDPTPVVSVIVPLLFGFMFPDIGHGLALAAAGYLLSRRYRQAFILVPCGLAAAAFGLLFGEFFGMHAFPGSPLGRVLDHPLEILLATLFLGVLLMTLGLVFSGIEAGWRGEHSQWLLEEAPVLLLYLSLVLIAVWRESWMVSMAALLWYLAGTALLCRRRRNSCLWRHLGHLLESLYQLGVATLSFMRVGAFALAHAAFSSMALQLLQQVDTLLLQVLLFVLVHTAIILVEGLVVMIQTTRLVLLEFFTRFLRFGGRVYVPLHRGARV